METVETQAFDPGVEFPAIPASETPDNATTLRRILLGQSALRDLYASADKKARGEGAFLCRLLRRDFETRFAETIAAGEALLRKLGGKARDGEAPPPERIEKVAARLREAPAEACIQAVSSFASRACICSQLVPWVSDIQEVFDHFKRSLEAEDHHLSVIDLFHDLVCGPQKKG